MARAAMFVQHSVTDPDGRIEGFPVAIAEAMFTALPVVSTRHSGIPEHVRDGATGFLVEEGDVAGMAAAMARLLADPGVAAGDGPGRPGLGARASVAAGLLRAAARSHGAGGRRSPPPRAGPEPMADRPPSRLFVLAYRQQGFVRAAIEGAFAQTYSPLEIVLSDDASPDGTFAVMQEMAAAYSGPHRVVLNRNEKNLGLTAHVSRVMALATGDFVVQNAGDDVSHPERVARLVAAWQAGGGRVTAVHSGTRRLGDGRRHRALPAVATADGGRDAPRGDPRRPAPDRRLARLGPRGLRRLRAAAGAGAGRGPADRLPRRPPRRDRLDRRRPPRLPHRRQLATPATR